MGGGGVGGGRGKRGPAYNLFVVGSYTGRRSQQRSHPAKPKVMSNNMAFGRKRHRCLGVALERKQRKAARLAAEDEAGR